MIHWWGKGCPGQLLAQGIQLHKIMTSALIVWLFAQGCALHSSRPGLKDLPIAVWDLEDMSPVRGGAVQPTVGEVLSAEITRVLKANAGMDVVEREHIVQLMEELRLGSGELASQDTRLRLGRLAGARYMVFGGYQRIGGKIRFDLRMIDVETGVVVSTSEKTIPDGPLEAWFEAVRAAALDLVKNY